jgi:hypothetical protein
VTNAKFAAPWYYTEDEQEEEKEKQDSEPKGVATKTAQVAGPWITASSPPSEDVILSGGFQDLTISLSEASPKKEPQVRYMLDYTLNRFCRWLRILGLDAALETEEEEKLRTKECKL